MKRNIKRLACSNCGKPLKSVFVEFCPRCNSILTPPIKKFDFKYLILMGPIALLTLYASFYFSFTNNEGFSFGRTLTFDEFNIIMVFVSIITMTTVLALYCFQKKIEKKFDKYIGMPNTAKMEIKEFEIEIKNKMIALQIISFIIILPVILIPAYIDITNDGIISSNQILSIIIILLAIFVFILPFIIGYYTLGVPEKKLLEGD